LCSTFAFTLALGLHLGYMDRAVSLEVLF